MFQFTTETIINSNVDSSGATKFFASGNTFSVLRAGNFKKAEVVSVYKNPYSAAVKEVVVATLAGTYVATKTYRLVINARLSGSANSEWANEFVFRSKYFTYEITGVDTVAKAATAFAAAVAKEGLLTGFSHFTLVDGGSGKLTLTANTEYQRFIGVEVQQLADGTVVDGATLTGYNNYTVVDDLRALAVAGASTNLFTAGKQGFGTTTWLTKNLRLPTIDRTNYTAIGQEELPAAGGQYTQYSIRTAVKRGDTGLGAVGQEMVSITTAVFYVLSTLVSAFESAMTTAGLTILDAKLGTGALALSYADNTIFVGDNAAPTITGAIGTVSYASGTTGHATVDATTGVVTGVGAGTSVITVTDTYTGGTKTATFTVTVLALA